MDSKRRLGKELQESTRMFQKVEATYNQAGLSFVHTELELAKTFCNIARNAPPDSDQRNRNVTNAKKAYAGALDALSKLTLPSEEVSPVEQLATEVRENLACI